MCGWGERKKGPEGKKFAIWCKRSALKISQTAIKVNFPGQESPRSYWGSQIFIASCAFKWCTFTFHQCNQEVNVCHCSHLSLTSCASAIRKWMCAIVCALFCGSERCHQHCQHCYWHCQCHQCHPHRHQLRLPPCIWWASCFLICS